MLDMFTIDSVKELTERIAYPGARQDDSCSYLRVNVI